MVICNLHLVFASWTYTVPSSFLVTHHSHSSQKRCSRHHFATQSNGIMQYHPPELLIFETVSLWLLLSLAPEHQPYHFLYSTPMQEPLLWPLVLGHPPASVPHLFSCCTTHQLILCFHFEHASHNHSLWATQFVSPCLGLWLTLLTIAVVDVHCLTSMTNNVSDTMYVLSPSIFVTFVIGDWKQT